MFSRRIWQIVHYARIKYKQRLAKSRSIIYGVLATVDYNNYIFETCVVALRKNTSSRNQSKSAAVSVTISCLSIENRYNEEKHQRYLAKFCWALASAFSIKPDVSPDGAYTIALNCISVVAWYMLAIYIIFEAISAMRLLKDTLTVILSWGELSGRGSIVWVDWDSWFAATKIWVVPRK